MDEEKLYQKARSLMNERNFLRAIDAYQMLEQRFPFGQFAEQAQLEIILANYKSGEYEAAIVAADRFNRLHPNHPEGDYAYYYRGLSNFEANRSVFERFFNLDMSKRDPSAVSESFNNFAGVLSRYPESRFAADARGRMIFLRNILARHEIHIADFYLRRGAYMAAVNRGNYVVEHFQKTPAVADGLAIMVQAYQMLGMQQQAQNSLKVLQDNFPEHLSLNDQGQFNPEYTLEASELTNAEKSKPGYGRPNKSL